MYISMFAHICTYIYIYIYVYIYIYTGVGLQVQFNMNIMFKDLTCILAKHPIMTNLAFPQNFVPSTDLTHQSISTRRNSWIHLFSNSSWIPRARNDCKKSYNSLFHIWSPSDETSLQNLELFCWKLLRSILYTFCSSQPFHILEFFSEMSLPKKRAEIFPDKRHQLERIDGDRHSHVLIYGSQNQSTELGSGNRHR